MSEYLCHPLYKGNFIAAHANLKKIVFFKGDNGEYMADIVFTVYTCLLLKRNTLLQ